MPTGPISDAARLPDLRTPPLAIVEYANAISSGVTPSSSPPSVMDGLVDSSVWMPMSWAVCAISSVPTWMPSSA